MLEKKAHYQLNHHLSSLVMFVDEEVGSCALLAYSNSKISWFKLIYISRNLKGRVDTEIYCSVVEYLPNMNEAIQSILRE